MNTNSTEDQLRAEIESLKRQLATQKPARRGPSTATLIVFAVVAIIVIVAGFFVGYLPRQRREDVLAAEAHETTRSLPLVNFAVVTRSAVAPRTTL